MGMFKEVELAAALWRGLGPPEPRALVLTGHAVVFCTQGASLRLARGSATLSFPVDVWATAAFSSPWGPVRVPVRVARRLASAQDVFVDVEFEQTPQSVADLDELRQSLERGAPGPEWRAEAEPLGLGVEMAWLGDWAEAVRQGRRRTALRLRSSSGSALAASRRGLEDDLAVDRALMGWPEQSR